MVLYSKEQLQRKTIEAREDMKNRAQDTLRWVTTLAATVLTLLFPVGYALKLSNHGRMLIFSSAVLLCGCLLAGVVCKLYTLRMVHRQAKAIRDYLRNYETYCTLLPPTEQIRRLTVGHVWPLETCATLSLFLFVAALLVLLALLFEILFPLEFAEILLINE